MAIDDLLRSNSTDLNDIADAIVKLYDALGGFWCGVSGGSANAQSVSTGYSLSTIPDGFEIVFEAGYTNTGAVDITIDSATAVDLTHANGDELIAGALMAGRKYRAIYDSTSGDAILQSTHRAIKDAASAQSISVSSTFAASYTAMTGASVDVEVEAGDFVLLTWATTFSSNNTGNVAAIAPHEDGTIVSNSQLAITPQTTSSVGYESQIGDSILITSPTAGTMTYALYWYRSSGAGTVYSYHRRINAIVFKGV